MEKNIFIALGSNLGDREENLLRGVSEVAKLRDSRVTALSPFYDTEPVGMAASYNFLNAVLKLESSLDADELLNGLMRIESDIFGRERRAGVESRLMDLDILFYGDVLIDRPPSLMIPHPRLHERKFVLVPLAEVAPAFRHPVLGKTVSELLVGLDDKSRVTRI